MTKISNNLFQFSVYIPPMDFTIHQYLLTSDPAILFATGSIQQAESVLPQIKEILNGKPLKYIFVSHIESDECGGVSVFLKKFPDVQVICSMLGARELPGFGYTGKLKVASSQEELSDGELNLQFFEYPAEVHLQDGIICYEKNSGIFYSADLMLRFGNGIGQTMKSNWNDEIEAISTMNIPNSDKLKHLKSELRSISPNLIAVGHGTCVECKK